MVKPSFEQIVNLGYGTRQIPFRFDPEQFSLLARHETMPAPLTDAGLRAALDAPINSPRLEEVVKPHERMVIVVPDATRAACVHRIAPLLVERLNKHGLSDSQISFLIGGGIHRAPTAEEIYGLLGSDLPTRIEVHPHNANDAASHASLGTTTRGTPVVLNRRLVEADRIIVVGAISLHYIAGFTEVANPNCRGAQPSGPYRPKTS